MDNITTYWTNSGNIYEVTGREGDMIIMSDINNGDLLLVTPKQFVDDFHLISYANISKLNCRR